MNFQYCKEGLERLFFRIAKDLAQKDIDESNRNLKNRLELLSKKKNDEAEKRLNQLKKEVGI